MEGWKEKHSFHPSILPFIPPYGKWQAEFGIRN